MHTCLRYEGQWYDECISQLNSAGAWCASSLSSTGDLLQKADCILDWGHYQDYLTKAQKVCASPYAIEEVWYKGCQGEKPWCAVKVDQDRQVVKWAHCDNPREVSVFSVTGERCVDVVAGTVKKVLKGCLVDGSLRGVPWCPLEIDDSGSVIKKGVCVPDWCPKKVVSRQTVNGQPCVLPFKNNGKVYLDCALHVPPTSEHESWCAVAVTDELEVKRWKNCKRGLVAVTNNIVTKQQRLCVLPFKFEGSVYFSCVRTNSTATLPGDHGWCATAVNENGEATERGDCPLISDRIDETILQMAEDCDDDESSSLPFSLLPDSDSEQWSSGDGSDTRCIVPYVFKNQTYWDCTRAGTTGDEDAWCAIEIDEFRNVIKKQKCSTSWHMRNTILGSGDLMSPKDRKFERYDTITGKECIFPFKSRDTNKVYTNCICPATECEGVHRSVCATEVDEFGYMTAHEPCRGVLVRSRTSAASTGLVTALTQEPTARRCGSQQGKGLDQCCKHWSKRLYLLRQRCGVGMEE
ncbi:Fibronectin type II collagen-binding [Trinorchestia longiramus]|nr:Fibronectin type II collagen-binding [Trinorchestia longiramus]